MKTLSIGKNYVTVYFFAIMVHCSLFYISVTKAASCNTMLMCTRYDSSFVFSWAFLGYECWNELELGVFVFSFAPNIPSGEFTN